jgi:preprotein translocase subunit SecA
VTIATNMAGRGTDIKLGEGVTESRSSKVKDSDGKEHEVMEDGGLHIIGSERHESRRIDRQLRGRAGRQGDPGATQFFLSLEDDLMRLFGSERIAKLMDRLGAQEGEVLAHPLITRSIEQAQKRVELQNFQARKRLLEYDDVMNQQREVIYSLRAFALEGGEELKGEALKMIERAIEHRVEQSLEGYDSESEWDFGVLRQDLLMHYLLFVPQFEEGAAEKPGTIADAKEMARAAANAAFIAKLASLDIYSDALLSRVMLHVLDEKWKDHLYDLDQLRNAIHYRSWGQKDPLVEYKQEAYTMFVDLMSDLYNTFAERFLRAQIVIEPPQAQAGDGDGSNGRRGPRVPAPTAPTRRYNALGILEDVPASDGGTEEPGEPEGNVDIGPDEAPKQQVVARKEARVVGAGRVTSLAPQAAANTDWSSVGRNDPCPCGSGKKFKKCHGATV